MGIRHRYFEAIDLLVTVWDGAITRDEWAEVARRHVADPTWAAGYRRLTDATSADVSALTSDDVEAIATIYRGAPGAELRGVKLAIVAYEGFELAQRSERDFHELGVTTFVFLDLSTACTWLGVPTDVVLEAVTDLRAQLRGGEAR